MKSNSNFPLKRWLKIMDGLLSCPTAPLHEDAPLRFVRQFAAKRPELSCTSDRAGNLLLKYPADSSAKDPLVLVAHLDHPGFHIEEVTGKKLQLKFRGRVGAAHARPGQRIRLFKAVTAKPVGIAELTGIQAADGGLAGAMAQVVEGSCKKGDFAMWDFPAFELVEDRIVGRQCDDGAGASMALCVLDYFCRAKMADINVQVLLTRAEEFGFLGAFEAVRLGTVRKNARIISLEASRAFSEAPLNGGCIVRVGDLRSIFNPDMTAALCSMAARLSGQQKDFRWRRRLMDGGTCEATIFNARGFRATGMALPLDNYHNQAFDKKGEPTIGPEGVGVNDFANAIQLLIELCKTPEAMEYVPDLENVLKPYEQRARELLGAAKK